MSGVLIGCPRLERVWVDGYWETSGAMKAAVDPPGLPSVPGGEGYPTEGVAYGDLLSRCGGCFRVPIFSSTPRVCLERCV